MNYVLHEICCLPQNMVLSVSTIARKQQGRYRYPFRNIIFINCNQMQKVATNTIFALPHVRCHSLVRVVHCLLQHIQPQKILSYLWNFETFYSFFDDFNQSV
jgi:hypothetical protein